MLNCHSLSWVYLHSIRFVWDFCFFCDFCGILGIFEIFVFLFKNGNKPPLTKCTDLLSQHFLSFFLVSGATSNQHQRLESKNQRLHVPMSWPLKTLEYLVGPSDDTTGIYIYHTGMRTMTVDIASIQGFLCAGVFEFFLEKRL